MPVTLSVGFLTVAALASVGLCLHGGYCRRRWSEPGVGPFATTLLLVGLGSLGGAVVALVYGQTLPTRVAPQWTDVALVGWIIAMVPWVLFAFEYTGRYEKIKRRTRVMVAIPAVVLAGLILFQTTPSNNALLQLLGSAGLLYTFALVAIGSYLLLRTTYDYGHLSVSQGATLTLSGIAPFLLLNSTQVVGGDVQNTVAAGLYALAFVIPLFGSTLAVFRYDIFGSTPAAGTIGERAISRETDDLVIVTDRDERVVKLNQTAVETLAVERATPLGDPLGELLGRSVEDLEGADTVELATGVGTQKFDPQVTSFTDQHGRRLGSLLSLRDVTDRELRKQRLEVFNRVLRHNLRNQVDVIKSNATAAADDTNSDYLNAIQESADGLISLSSKARATDELVSQPTQASAGDLVETVRELVDTEAVSLEAPDTAPLVTDWDALRWALESAIENAVEHADSAVTVRIHPADGGYTIAVADDGPGIPESEIASLDAETETPLRHGTGLGLWQLKWGVTKLHGSLEFDTTEGTTVRITVPHWQSEQTDPSE